MPPLSELPGSTPRRKILIALKRLGFIIDTSGGNGSHVMAKWPSTNKSVTIPFEDISKQTLKYIIPQIEAVTLGKIDWEKLKEAL